ncbi:hypothetical protein C1645_833645 [Glomus cerebriforme]|uniref:Uncharacterized protein n=1 Tax=Glomus cerebriforme TaxID=658196 RepID=A0A397SHX9_9GLOM|nr:hypothetical protein C1645_833645 [Glomus cerebriforme]
MAKAQHLMCEDLEIGEKVLTIPCIAYQTNLLVKKIVKSSIFGPVIKMLLTIINHFQNSNLALAKFNEKGIKSEKLLQIQEDAYSLFCILYPDKDNAAFVDEWLDYQNKKGVFKAESLNSSNLTKTPLRYW